MKKLTTIILLLSVISLNAQDFKIIPKAKIEYDISKDIGLQIPYNGSDIYGGHILVGRQMTGIGIDFVYKNLSLSFDNETYMIDDWQNLVFSPTQTDFFVKFQYQYKPVKLYIEHACFHPAISLDGIGKSYKDTKQIVTGYKGGYTRLGISYNY